MRRIASFNNGLGPRSEEFDDRVIRITNAYLALREREGTKSPGQLISTAAESVGWEVRSDGAVMALVEDISHRSLYQNPLIREHHWNTDLTMAALNERT